MPDLHLLCPIGSRELGRAAGMNGSLSSGFRANTPVSPSGSTCRLCRSFSPNYPHASSGLCSARFIRRFGHGPGDRRDAGGNWSGRWASAISESGGGYQALKGESIAAPASPADAGAVRFIERGIDRAALVAFRPPEVLRAFSLVHALAAPPVEEWVDPAGLVAARAGLIETYPPGGLQT